MKKKKVYIVTSNLSDHKGLRKEFKTFGAAERFIRSICPEAIKTCWGFKCYGPYYEYRMFVHKEWRGETNLA